MEAGLLHPLTISRPCALLEVPLVVSAAILLHDPHMDCNSNSLGPTTQSELGNPCVHHAYVRTQVFVGQS